MSNLINRTTVQTEENKYRLYPKAGPINYKKSDGTFGEIDLTFNDTSSSIGDISLMNKGVVSVGKRKGNNPHKVVGIRPDGNQHLGTQQLEFSLVNVELDGVSQSFNVETDLEVILGPAQVFQLVKTDKDFNDFKIEFDIHNKGLELQNSKYSSATIIREDFDFNLTNLGEIEGGNTSLTKENVYNNSSGSIIQKNTPHLDFYTSHITNDYIQTGEYSIEEEFGDSDLSSYKLEPMYSAGSSIYFKDSIVLNVKSYQIEDVKDIVINNLCYLYGLEVLDDGGAGKYFTKNNKKVGAYVETEKLDEFYVMFNTKEIPDDVKTLFKKKTFDDTSYLDITLSDFSTTITNHFNKNIKIEVDTDYYEPINDKFFFKIKNESFHINLPSLFDENKNILQLETTHTLKQNSDGSYRYTKYFSMYGYLKNSHNIKYIDADLSVGTYNKNIYHKIPAGSSTATTFQRTATNLNTARDASTGGFAASGFATSVVGMAGNSSVSTLPQGSSVRRYSWTNYNNYIQVYDTSGISGTVSSATLKQKGYLSRGLSWIGVNGFIVVKFDSDLAEGITDWMDIAGHTSGWSDSDATAYSADTNVTATTAPGNTDDFTLNSDCRSDIQNNNEVQFAVMEHTEFYQNSLQSGISTTSSQTYFYYSYPTNSSTAANRPYIEYEVASASGYTHKVVGVAAANIGKVNGVATANIGKVIGVD